MKEVTIRFGSCYRCPYATGKVESGEDGDTSYINLCPYCSKKRKVIKNVLKIPKWYPLEDVK